MAMHRRWSERHSPPASVWPFYENPPDPNRVLRVGYVSPDFRLHAVAYFMEPILANHNRSRVESYCYADVAVPDTMTQHLQSRAHQWRQTVNMPHEALFNGIRQDRIDILVDLCGHMGNNRLQVFARKPAPIQVSYLGYPATTGLPAIDYRLVDAITHPPVIGHVSLERPYDRLRIVVDGGAGGHAPRPALCRPNGGQRAHLSGFARTDRRNARGISAAGGQAGP